MLNLHEDNHQIRVNLMLKAEPLKEGLNQLRTKDGQTTSLNGWNYWEAKLPSSAEWVPIKSLRSHSTIRRFG